MADTNLTAPSRTGVSIVTRIPFYYGWIMLLVAMLAQMATFPGQTVGVSVFNVSFRESLHLNHGQLTGVYTLGSLIGTMIWIRTRKRSRLGPDAAEPQFLIFDLRFLIGIAC